MELSEGRNIITTDAIGREKLAMFCRAVASLPALCRKAVLNIGRK